MIALAPATHALHRRWGLTAPLIAVAAMVVIDAIRIALEHPWIADVNYLLAWASIHQLGYSWHDGRLTGRRVGGQLAAAGFVLLVGLTVVGPYPVSMVTVPGADLQNTEPPTLALLALATTQTGAVLVLRDRADRWLHHGRRWRLVSRLQAVLLTLFLWHMAAAAIAAVILHGTGIMAVASIGSPTWLLLRIPWVALCALVLAAFVALFSSVERVTRHDRRGRRTGRGITAAAAVVGIVGVLVGILAIAVTGAGFHGPLALPTGALVTYGIGAALLALAVVRS